MKLVFMGTPDFSVPILESLRDAGHQIAAVYSQPPRPSGRGQQEHLSPVHEFAAGRNIRVLTPKSSFALAGMPRRSFSRMAM